MKNAWDFKGASCLLPEGSRTYRKILESICSTEASARRIPVLLKNSGKADQGTKAITAAPAIHSWTHREKVFCCPGDWLLFLLALKEGLNTLMACSDLRLYPDSWNNTYMSNQYRLPLSETNNMWGVQVRVSVWQSTKVRKWHWKLQCLLEATMRYLILGSVSKVWRHFGVSMVPKDIALFKTGSKVLRGADSLLHLFVMEVNPFGTAIKTVLSQLFLSVLVIIQCLFQFQNLDCFRTFSVSTAHKDSYHVPTSHSCYWLV